jgi:hypothetical protein
MVAELSALETAPGVEPGWTGLRPAALPLGHAVLVSLRTSPLWSRRPGSNGRPPAPEAGTLPSCATTRWCGGNSDPWLPHRADRGT